MTKKKKTKMPAKTPSAYDRFYPPVQKEGRGIHPHVFMGQKKKEAKKNEPSDGESRADEGNKEDGGTE